MTATKATVVRWIEERHDSAVGTDPRDFDAAYVRRMIRRLDLLFGEHLNRRSHRTQR